MKQNLVLNVASRAQSGRSASRRLRKANRVPAILYGKHTSPEMLAVDGPEFTRLLKALGGRSILIELAREGKSEKALSFLQEVQRDPITERYLHVDLQEVKADETFEIRVRIQITGESFGVKNQSGVLEVATQQLRVRCLPKDLPEHITVDVSSLELGKSIHVGEITFPEGVRPKLAADVVVVMCEEPKVEAEPEPSAAAAAAAKAAPAAKAAAAPAAKK